MRGSGRKNLIMFRKVLGMKGMANCRLVTTKWSLQDDKVSKAREQELCEKEEFWRPLLAAGARDVRFGDSKQSAIEIIKPLIQGPAFEPLLVEDVVRDKKPLRQTQAGKDKLGEQLLTPGLVHFLFASKTVEENLVEENFLSSLNFPSHSRIQTDTVDYWPSQKRPFRLRLLLTHP